MIILGVDPGLADTGWGVISYEKGIFQPVSYGTVKTSAGDPIQKRIFTIAEDLAELAMRFKAEVVAMEDIFFAKNISSAIPVAKVIGAALYRFEALGLDVHLYSPREIKMNITGMGNADKFQVQDMVRRLLRLKEIPKPDHAADALADCVCYCSHLAFDNKIKT